MTERTRTVATARGVVVVPLTDDEIAEREAEEAAEAARLSPPFVLADAVTRAKRAIDDAAEAARLTWITGGSGQALVYDRKQAEAEAFTAAGDGTATDYPLLAASLGIEGETLAEVAAVVLATRAQWVTVAAAIERIRLGAKRQLNDLGQDATADDVDAIVSVATFPTSPGT